MEPVPDHKLPVAQGLSAGWLAVFATVKSKDQSLLYYIQLARRPQALTSSKFSCLRKTACVCAWATCGVYRISSLHKYASQQASFAWTSVACAFVKVCKSFRVCRRPYISVLGVELCHGIVLCLFDAKSDSIAFTFFKNVESGGLGSWLQRAQFAQGRIYSWVPACGTCTPRVRQLPAWARGRLS